MFWAFEKSIWEEHFPFFVNFWVTKLKPFSGKVKQSVQNYLNQNLVIGSFFKWFWSYLELKNECSKRLKRAFFSFLQFLRDEAETIFWESEAKQSKLFKSKFGHRKLLRKWFWSYLELTNVLSVWKEHFSVFCKFLSDEVETVFRESEAIF